MTVTHAPMLDRRLHHVIAVAETGSFTKAADRAGITQSAITRSIADLERELRYALFYRTARGALLTEQGRDFVDRARRLLEDAQALLGAGEREDSFSRTLRIGVCPASSEWRLAEPLARLIARHPRLRFEVLGSSLERLVQLARSGGVDVAFGYEDAFLEWTDLKRDRCGQVQGVLFVRKGHPLLDLKAVSYADLTAYNCILPADTKPFSTVLRELYGAKGVNWHERLLVTDNLNIMMRVVANSDAFALTSAEVTQSPGFAETFEGLAVKDLFQPFHLCCATRARWELSPVVTAFLRVMRETTPKRYGFVA